MHSYQGMSHHSYGRIKDGGHHDNNQIWDGATSQRFLLRMEQFGIFGAEAAIRKTNSSGSHGLRKTCVDDDKFIH